jgi:hypothetical protein
LKAKICPRANGEGGEGWEGLEESVGKKGLVQEEGNVDNVDYVITAMTSSWFLVWAKNYW